MARASLHGCLSIIKTPKIIPPELLYVTADPLNYTQKVGSPSVTSGCTMDPMIIV